MAQIASFMVRSRSSMKVTEISTYNVSAIAEHAQDI